MCLYIYIIILNEKQAKKLKNQEKKILKKLNYKKKSIEIFKKRTGSVRFRFYKPETEKTNQTKPNRKKPSQTSLNRFFPKKTKPKPVGLNRFHFFLNQFGYLFFIKTEPNRK
jgi:hypothetical protein